MSDTQIILNVLEADIFACFLFIPFLFLFFPAIVSVTKLNYITASYGSVYIKHRKRRIVQVYRNIIIDAVKFLETVTIIRF